MSKGARALRRLRTYRRRIASMPLGRLRRNCFFMHVPKCGGSSVAEALYAVVPMQQRVGVIDANASRRATAMIHSGKDELLTYFDDIETGAAVYEFRRAMLLYHMAWNTAMIHGHVLYSDLAQQLFADRYAFVTMLREPVSRTLSNYAHTVQTGVIADDFEAYLDGFVARAHGLSFLRYFSGRHRIDREDEASALAAAKANLEKFDVVGFLDDLPAFCKAIGDVTGRVPKVYRYNEKRWPPARPTSAQLDRLRAILAPEIAFWDHANAVRRGGLPSGAG